MLFNSNYKYFEYHINNLHVFLFVKNFEVNILIAIFLYWISEVEDKRIVCACNETSLMSQVIPNLDPVETAVEFLLLVT